MTDREYMKAQRVVLVTGYITNKLPILVADAPSLTVFLNELSTHNDEINRLRKITSDDITIATDDTNKKRGVMEVLAMKVSGCLRAYFVSVDDKLNAERAYLTVGLLQNSRQESSLFLCENLFAMAQEFSTQIAPMGVSPALLASLETAVEQYRISLLDTKMQRKEWKAAFKKIPEVLSACDRVLVALSAIMEVLKDKHLEIYLVFKRHMRIGKSGGGKGKKPNFEQQIEPGEVAVVANVEYQAKRSFKVKNKSKVSVKWGLSVSETEFSAPANMLLAKAKSQKLSSTLAKQGNFLIFKNEGNQPALVQVWLIGGDKEEGQTPG